MSKLGPISSICVGDVTNRGKNVLIIITTNGWCYLYSNSEIVTNEPLVDKSNNTDVEQVGYSLANK